ncbi:MULTISPECIES: epoxide hydrolase family protein [Nostoc]|uniref:Epoxide hydrolase n=2 Tax=Nostoc TaxID=1177 RepID=A0ABR8IGA0_9NOSO|nr:MULTISPECIES: epoxide hydrolase family protein [Nostoc]MBD2564752.1 epoxide hydrolase [Nostoc linckia FACHB-391]MBD2650634.1 epoxide hydrolase [Nostoc foliaceum FACHB-393]
MTKLKKVHYKAKARTAGTFVLSRLLVALLAATVFLAPPARLLAQQFTQTDAQTQVAGKATEDNAIRPFRVHVPQEAIVDLRRRIATTRWSDKETVADQSQGVQLATMKELVRYWGTKYDWRKAEAKLNALPQFVTNIDGLNIHFIHVRSKNSNALPLLVTHGWPGSVFEQLKIIGPLTDPTAYGGRPEDAFDLVIPSIPGYGFSGKPTDTGWDSNRIARAWAELMKRLDYTRYVAQGGDWGSPISSTMARQAPAGLLGIHINLPATIPPEVASVLASGGPAPAGLSEKERAAYDSLDTLNKKKRAYAVVMGTQPQTVGYGLTDSPTGLAAWMLGHPGFAQWTYSGGDSQKSPTKDEVLDDITLYWLTNSAVSSARLYWENNTSILNAAAQKTADISLPVAITVFPEEVYRTPETWARRAYRNLIYFHEVDKGGHFAAWEQPQLFSEEIRAAFKSLR